MQFKIANTVKDSIVDGPGMRYVVFTQGCYHNCDGCHNPQTHDPNGGVLVDTEDIINEFFESDYDGITFSGGEPFLHAEALADIAIRIKERDKSKSIICYTGYTYEELQKIINEGNYSYSKLLRNVDYIIDGRFIKSKATLDCPWRGSDNQRIVNVKISLKVGEVITTEL